MKLTIQFRQTIMVVLAVFCLAGGAFAQRDLFRTGALAKTASIDQAQLASKAIRADIKRYKLAELAIPSFDIEENISLNFFSDADFAATIRKVSAEGVTDLWTGTIPRLPGSIVEIFHHGDSVRGLVDIGQAMYAFEMLNGAVLITEVDKTKLPRLDNDQRFYKGK